MTASVSVALIHTCVIVPLSVRLQLTNFAKQHLKLLSNHLSYWLTTINVINPLYVTSNTEKAKRKQKETQ